LKSPIDSAIHKLLLSHSEHPRESFVEVALKKASETIGSVLVVPVMIKDLAVVVLENIGADLLGQQFGGVTNHDGEGV